MNCFPCFSSQKSKKESSKREHDSSPYDDPIQSRMPENMEASNQADHGNIAAQTFNFRELAAATKNFRQECLLGEGGFGRVYKGTLQATGKVVAVKQLDRNAMQGNKEFLVEVSQLSHLRHENLVNLIGYCADGDQRLLVYEYMPAGSVEDHLFDLKPGKTPFDWITRMKIAYGAAQGLEYLHDKANPPVIYRDLKSSNVLLDEEFNPKLSDIGLAKLGPSTDKMPMQSRAMGTYGYSAPEYSRTGKLTTTADVYSFGVVLLELITGRRAIDTTKPVDEQNLVAWAQPLFREPKHFPDMADPLLKKKFPERGLNQAVAIAAMCLQDEAAARPLMSDVVTALSFLSMATEENKIPPTLPPSISSKLHCISTKLQFLEHGDHSKLNKQDSSSDSESDEDERNSQDEGSDSPDGDRSVNNKRENRRSSDGTSASSIENDGSASSGDESCGKRLSHKYSKESKDTSFTSCHQDSRKSLGNDDANISSSDESQSSSGEIGTSQKNSRRSKSPKDSSMETTDASTDQKNKSRSEDGSNDCLGRNSSNKLTDESITSTVPAASGGKNGKKSKESGKSGKKSQEGRHKKSQQQSKASHSRDDSNSSGSGKNNRRRPKKVKDSPSPSSSGGSQDEILEGNHRQPTVTFTKAKTNNF